MKGIFQFVKSRYDFWVSLKTHVEKKLGVRATLEFIALSMSVLTFPFNLFIYLFMKETVGVFGDFKDSYASQPQFWLPVYFLQVMIWVFYLAGKLMPQSQNAESVRHCVVFCIVISFVVALLPLLFFHEHLLLDEDSFYYLPILGRIAFGLFAMSLLTWESDFFRSLLFLIFDPRYDTEELERAIEGLGEEKTSIKGFYVFIFLDILVVLVGLFPEVFFKIIELIVSVLLYFND